MPIRSENEPLIKLEPGGKAPILSYNVPEPTSYSGRNFIELDFLTEEETAESFFKPAAFEKPSDGARTPVEPLELRTATSSVVAALRSGFSDRRLFPNVRLTSGVLRFRELSNPGARLEGSVPVS
jgi:hypothetical protein